MNRNTFSFLLSGYLLLLLSISTSGQSTFQYDATGNLTNIATAASGLPTVVGPLENQNVNAWNDAAFSVVVGGLGPMSYQWYHNGALIQGATDGTLYLPSVSVSNEGSYAVVVCNASGCVTSAVPAVLELSATNWTWVGSISEDWFDPPNWRPVSVPKSYASITIQNATINLNAPVTISGTLVCSNVSFEGNSMTIATNAVLDVSGTLDLFAPLTNAGTVNWGGAGDLTIHNDNAEPFYYTGGIVNLAGAVFNVQNDQSIAFAGVSPYFNNAGLFLKSPTTGTSTVNVAFNNTGTVEVSSGTVAFNGGGSGTGTFDTSAGAGISFGNDNSGTTFSGAGTYTVSNGIVTATDGAMQSVVLSGGTFNVGGTISNLTWNGGALAGTNTIRGIANWTSGSVGVGSSVTIASTAVLNIIGNSTLDLFGTLANEGTVNWGGTGDLTIHNDNAEPFYYTGGIVNLAGGIFNVKNDQSIVFAGVAPYFNNAGLFLKSPTTGTSTVNVAFNNTGTVEVSSGIVAFNGGGSGTGTFDTSAGAGISFGNDNSGTTFSGAGIYTVSNGTVTATDGAMQSVMLSGGTFNVAGAISNLTWNGGTLAGTNTITGNANWTSGSVGVGGSVTIASNAVLNITANSTLDLFGTLVNAGTVNWEGTGDLTIHNDNADPYYYTGGIVNLAGGIFNVENDQTIIFAGISPYFNNAGLFLKSPTRGASTVNVAFNNTGTVDVESGIIVFNGGEKLTGGTLDFGIMNMTNFGEIGFSGQTMLGGTLAVHFINGYTPTASNSFALLSYGAESGAFNILSLPSSVTWQGNYGSTVFNLTVLGTAPVLPILLPFVSTASAPGQPGEFLLQFSGNTNSIYTVLASTNLGLPVSNWSDLGTATLLSNTQFQFIDTQSTNLSSRYYRLRAP